MKSKCQPGFRYFIAYVQRTDAYEIGVRKYDAVKIGGRVELCKFQKMQIKKNGGSGLKFDIIKFGRTISLKKNIGSNFVRNVTFI